MSMSEDERRELRALEAQLAGQRRLVTLSRRLGTASVDTGLRRVKTLWLTGGGAGLALVVAGAAASSPAVLAAAVAVLAATLVLVGAGSMIVEITGYRREQRPGGGRRPRSGSPTLPPSSAACQAALGDLVRDR